MSTVNTALPAELGRIIGRALEKDREVRYQTAKDLLADLKRLRRDVASGKRQPAGETSTTTLVPAPQSRSVRFTRMAAVLAIVVLVLVALSFSVRRLTRRPETKAGGTWVSKRLTFESGVHLYPSWSPDGRLFAYCGDKAGNLDIWVRQIGEGQAIRVTDDPAADCEPDWSPDGKEIVFRSERGGGSLYVSPALGGPARPIGKAGYWPRWSPNGSSVLASSTPTNLPHTRYSVIDTTTGASRELSRPDDLDLWYPSATAWHPDGRRITTVGVRRFPGNEPGRAGGFWTSSAAGGAPVRTEIPAEIDARFERLGIHGINELVWAPSGDALYLGVSANSAWNVWRITVDSETLRWVAGPESLATVDTGFGLSLSGDGSRLLFTSANDWSRLRSVPLDATAGRVRGEGEWLEVEGTFPRSPTLSQDGRWLTYVVGRQEQDELRRRDLRDGTDRILARDVGSPASSPDGRRAAYVTRVAGAPALSFATRVLTIDTGEEKPLPALVLPADWSPDGRWIVGIGRTDTKPTHLALIPLAQSGETVSRELAHDPEVDLWQPRFSPDGRWIAFEAVLRGADIGSSLRIMGASGGHWRAVTTGLYAHKPRWSFDGRRLYFLVLDKGLHNVWSLPLDPSTGMAVGSPHPVTSFTNVERGILPDLAHNDFAIGAHRLILPMVDYSATSIWMIENVPPTRQPPQ